LARSLSITSKTGPSGLGLKIFLIRLDCLWQTFSLKSGGHWLVLQQHTSAPVTDSIWPFYLGSIRKKPAEYDADREYPASDLKEDFDLLWLALEEAHPGLYRYTSQEEFAGLFRSLFSNIESEMTEIEFFRYVCPVIEKIHCLHTRIRPSEDYRKYMEDNGLFFPLKLKFFNGIKMH
jgi:hypothetical protein